jgi:hypothetical protein
MAGHRLVSAGREVQDGETSKAECEIESLIPELVEIGKRKTGIGVRTAARSRTGSMCIDQQITFVIRSSMLDGVCRELQLSQVNCRAVKVPDSENSAP